MRAMNRGPALRPASSNDRRRRGWTPATPLRDASARSSAVVLRR